MRSIHSAAGYAIVVVLAVLWLWALGAWIARRSDVHALFWTLLGFVQVALVLQLIAGLVLIVLGRRQPFLHYLYGSLFPAVALALGHVFARNRETGLAPWKVFGFASFIAFGLTLRALTTGLGIG